jgi:RecA/RadA recombinase
MTTTVTLSELEHDLSRRFDVSLRLRQTPAPELMATGIPAVNFPRGTLTEIFGVGGSGKTSLLMGALAHATRRPECCALVDASDSFDPAGAQNAGVHLPHLLWVRCGGNVEAALKAVDLLVHAGGFGMVALDLAGVPARQARRISLASWFRLRHAVRDTPAALMVVESELNAHSCSTLQIEHQLMRSEIRGKLLRSITAKATTGPRQRAVSELSFQPFYHP